MKEVMVFVDAGTSSPSHFHSAASIAKAHEALLTGVCSVGLPGIPGYVGVEIGTDLMGRLVESRREQARRLEAAFHTAAGQAGAASAWRIDQGLLPAAALGQGRTADLVVLRQAGPGQSEDATDLDHIVFSLGRPVIQVPHAGFAKPVGRRIVLGWNGARESARAAHDALPFLCSAEAVAVLGIDPDSAAQAGLERLLAHLERYGVSAALRTIRGGDASDALLDAAADFSADLLVMGAYGHSRMRELVLGGATRGVSRRATLPVLFSH